jgi:hypothetical protein
MTHGALIFAQNNAVIDYIKMAEFAASRIEKYLDVPVSLVTDTPDAVTSDVFDKIITIEPTVAHSQKTYNDGIAQHQKVDWKNFARSGTYNLTPYDKTLVIDSDYIINSSVLKPAFEREFDLQIYRNSMPLATWRNTLEFTRLSQYSIPFYWATTFIFEKNSTTEAFFNLIEYIKINWTYYRQLYNVASTIFRNDHAFSIAIHLMNNKTNGDFAIELPGTMTYITDRDMLVEIKDNAMQFLVQKERSISEYIPAKTTGIDVHVMNKLSLLRAIENV